MESQDNIFFTIVGVRFAGRKVVLYVAWTSGTDVDFIAW